MSDVKQLNLTIDLCLRIGEMLLSSGAGAADVTVTMDSVARHLGMRNAEIDVTFTSLAMSHQYDAEQPALSMIRNVKQRDIDYNDLTAVDHLVRDILDDRADVYLARSRMATIVSVGHPTHRWLVTIAWGVMCASVAAFLGGGVVVCGIASLAAMSIDRVQLAMARRRLPAFYQQVFGGVVATLWALAAAASEIDVDPSLVVTANIVMLLAGVGFMGAIQDALTGFYVTSAARLIEALLATAGIIAGVSGGLSLGQRIGVDVGRLDPGYSGWEATWVLVVGSAVCAAAFAYASYSPARALLPIASVSALGAAMSRLVEEAGFGRIWGAGTAAFVIGVVAYFVAGRIRVPPLVIVVSAVVPLLPGLSIYRGLSLLAAGGGQVSLGLLAMVTAAGVAIALASGVILGEYVAQPLKREARRLEDRLSGPRLVGPMRARTKR
ncbi:threonine/serine exporter ThrE family protein [uncultured Nocardioides sp.]|uniref:Possible amino acid export carrier protein n=1 Tax=uncultured Nocardioides sp. TaxID=198441 RepID=A0A6J4N2H2_9ACTN|nr:threonine/serine exporter family protein [uncultured Nocardioides sp.]CAA9376135.1 MAG: possible amino acid export carrier protein [uncultured Nocardioides sp.]